MTDRLVNARELEQLVPKSNYWAWLALMRTGCINDAQMQDKTQVASLRSAIEWAKEHGVPDRHHPRVLEAANKLPELSGEIRKLKNLKPRQPSPFVGIYVASDPFKEISAGIMKLAGNRDQAPPDVTLAVASLLMRLGYDSPDGDDLVLLSKQLKRYLRGKRRDRARPPRMTA